jgi:predicted nucleotidyltransferase component of viral defense system
LEAGSYPTSIEEIAAWQKANKTASEEARRRFIQFVVLSAISFSPRLGLRLAFKGGNALRFIHGNPRSTVDLDFTADGDLPDDSAKITALLNAGLKSLQARTRVKARCQSIKRKPPGADKTLPTYSIKVCFQLPGDRYYQNFEERKQFSEVVELEISFNDIVCETVLWRPHPSIEPLRSCSLEDIIAEKLRALLQQIPRERSRPQDVFDIASRVRELGHRLDLAKVSAFLKRKSDAREILPKKGAYNDEVRSRAAAGYETEVEAQTRAFIPFDEAWEEVLTLVRKLDIPD